MNKHEYISRQDVTVTAFQVPQHVDDPCEELIELLDTYDELLGDDEGIYIYDDMGYTLVSPGEWIVVNPKTHMVDHMRDRTFKKVYAPRWAEEQLAAEPKSRDRGVAVTVSEQDTFTILLCVANLTKQIQADSEASSEIKASAVKARKRIENSLITALAEKYSQ